MAAAVFDNSTTALVVMTHVTRYNKSCEYRNGGDYARTFRLNPLKYFVGPRDQSDKRLWSVCALPIVMIYYCSTLHRMFRCRRTTSLTTTCNVTWEAEFCRGDEGLLCCTSKVLKCWRNKKKITSGVRRNFVCAKRNRLLLLNNDKIELRRKMLECLRKK